MYLTVVGQPVRQAVAAWFPSSGSEWFDVHARRENPSEKKRDLRMKVSF